MKPFYKYSGLRRHHWKVFESKKICLFQRYFSSKKDFKESFLQENTFDYLVSKCVLFEKTPWKSSTEDGLEEVIYSRRPLGRHILKKFSRIISIPVSYLRRLILLKKILKRFPLQEYLWKKSLGSFLFEKTTWRKSPWNLVSRENFLSAADPLNIFYPKKITRRCPFQRRKKKNNCGRYFLAGRPLEGLLFPKRPKKYFEYSYVPRRPALYPTKISIKTMYRKPTNRNRLKKGSKIPSIYRRHAQIHLNIEHMKKLIKGLPINTLLSIEDP